MSIGINVNGDVREDVLISRAKLCDRLGISIWIGELDNLDPFETAKFLAEYTEKEMFLFCSPSRRSLAEITFKLERLRSRFDNDFSLVLVMGKSKKVKPFVRSVRLLKEKLGNVLVGCNGVKVFNSVHELADGFVFNYGVKFETDKFKACYVPALVLPSEMKKELLMSSAVLLSDKLKLGVDFEFVSRSRGNLDLPRSILENSGILLKHTISGSVEEVAKRIVEALRYYDHVILGVPFFMDENSVKSIERIIKLVEWLLEKGSKFGGDRG